MLNAASFAAALDAAEAWETKHQPTWASKSLSTALMVALSLAVVEQPDSANGIAWLNAQGIQDILRRQLRATHALICEVEKDRLPSSVIAGNYRSLVFAHIAWCLSEFDLGEQYVRVSMRPDVQQLSTKFWNVYAQSMSSLVRGVECRFVQTRLKGQERYWAAYLRVMADACKGQSMHESLAAARAAFVQRNADKNIRDDHYSIEGSPSAPSRWDFRLFGLMLYIDRSSVKPRTE